MRRYFLLWLDSYTQQYTAWKTHVLQTRTSKHHTLSWKQHHQNQPPSSASYSNNTNTNTYTSEGSGSVPKSFIATQGSHLQAEMDLDASRKLKRVYTSAPPSKALAYHWHQAHRAFFPHLQSNSPNSHSRFLSSRDDSPHLALRVDPVLFEPLLRVESSHNDDDTDSDHDSKTSPSTGKNQHKHKTNKTTTTKKSRRANPNPRRGRQRQRQRQIVGGAYPPPDAFLPLRRDVEARLRESAAAFVRASCSNSG